jgi:hypothetical protein
MHTCNAAFLALATVLLSLSVRGLIVVQYWLKIQIQIYRYRCKYGYSDLVTDTVIWLRIYVYSLIVSVFVLARAFRHTLSVQTFALHGAVFFSLLWSAFLWAVLLSLPENMTSTRTANLRLGSFNVGVVQSMLTGKNVRKVMEKASDVITLCVQDFGLHMFSMCEFGGHQQGLEDASIDYRNMKVFQAGPEAVVSANYMTAWNFAADASGLVVRHLGLENHNLKSSGTAEPHLVVTTFQVGADAGLIQGNLHIRTPTGAKVSICTRKRVLIEALRILEGTPAPTDSDGVLQPIAYVLVGDPNLSKEDAEEAVQALQPNDPQWDTVWHVHETTEQRRGDIVLVKGAHAMALELPVGTGCARNDQIGNDCHDAIGVEVRFYPRGASQPAPESTVQAQKRSPEQQLHAAIAKKRRSPWSGCHPGEEQYGEAVVSRQHAMQQLLRLMEQREREGRPVGSRSFIRWAKEVEAQVDSAKPEQKGG